VWLLAPSRRAEPKQSGLSGNAISIKRSAPGTWVRAYPSLADPCFLGRLDRLLRSDLAIIFASWASAFYLVFAVKAPAALDSRRSM